MHPTSQTLQILANCGMGMVDEIAKNAKVAAFCGGDPRTARRMVEDAVAEAQACIKAREQHAEAEKAKLEAESKKVTEAA